jgi:hypothetical protein
MGTLHLSKKNKRRRRGFFDPKRESKSKSGWVLYLMVNFPLVVFWKVGITGKSATERARSVDKDVFGVPIPVFIVVVPGAYFIEQWIHRQLGFLSVDYYKGDGHTEWLWFPCIVFVLPVMLVLWGVYFWLLSICTNWNGLEWYIMTLGIIAKWTFDFLKTIV